MSATTDRSISRIHVDGIRTSAPQLLPMLVADVIRTHIDRIAVPCIADVFAVAECDLPGGLAEELSRWSVRASQEIRDLPDVEALSFLAELGAVPPAQVPAAMRAAVGALSKSPLAAVSNAVSELQATWADVPPEKVVMQRQPKTAPAPKASRARPVDEPAATPAPKATPKPRATRAAAATVDPARAEFVRKDIIERLTLREYAERGLKESILAAGVKHRSPFPDMTEDEILAELRRMERERKLRSTGGRWVLR